MKTFSDDIDELMEAVEASVITLDSGLQLAKHPLYNTIWSHESFEMDGDQAERFGKGYLRRYLQQRIDLINTAIDESDWDRVVFLHERPWRPDVLLQIILSRQIKAIDQKVAEMVLDVWVDTESPQHSHETWARIFGLVSHKLMNSRLTQEELGERDALPDVLTIYRGTSMDERLSKRYGFSWTLDYERACWFASRFKQDEPIVITTTVNKSVAVGPLNRRGESEILVHPMHLDNLFHIKEIENET